MRHSSIGTTVKKSIITGCHLVVDEMPAFMIFAPTKNVEGRIMSADDDDEWMSLDMSGLARQLVADMEELIVDFDVSSQRNLEQLAEIERGQIPLHAPDDMALPLARIICHPAFGGHLAGDPAWDIPGATLTVDKLREAIKRGHLKDCPVDLKNRYTTVANIKEWLAEWPDVENPRELNSRPNASIAMAASKKPSGSSNISTREKDAKLSSAQASALMKAQTLRNTLRSGS